MFFDREFAVAHLLARRKALHRSHNSSRAAGFARAICWIVPVVCAGCQTATYTARKLPPQLHAAPAATHAGINLEQMGGAGAGTSQIAPGDLVQITIVSGNVEERATPLPARVSNDGIIMVPLVGAVAVSGLEPVAAEQRIAAAAMERGIYRQPYVTLTVTEPAVNRVTVLGAVTKPGVVELPHGASDLASAIAAAGGLAKDAGTQVEILRQSSPSFLAGQRTDRSANSSSAVQLASYNETTNPKNAPFAAPAPLEIHGQPAPLTAAWRPPPSELTRIDLAQAAAAPPQSRKLEDRDVVMVLAEDKRVIHVTGLVRKPDQFELVRDKNIRVLDAIAMAGSTTSVVADKVYVIRQFPNMPEPAVIEVSIARAKQHGNENLVLAAGDLVSVETTAATMMVDTATKFFRMAIGVNGNWAAL
jgi:polysaccharide export outer membrane protein